MDAIICRIEHNVEGTDFVFFASVVALLRISNLQDPKMGVVAATVKLAEVAMLIVRSMQGASCCCRI
ncbi:hypothetical protein Ae201684P_015650 [Aphanomyces euteiches]|uniref:Uncharacterized protein n=1 Tax=Aphanomyces euteiches TaxID=100861 RepID=A0A6G0W7R5_9STRA|nr:hypothetical protein Ae201684_017907 [Aphanomyces euteiches]KAH9095201.1 hypothetical protein Ae201684P_015650 [Aphanomyces euteiches]